MNDLSIRFYKLTMALFLSWSLFTACTERVKEIKPTLILTNGHIWTGKDSASFVQALAITGNTITEVGATETILALAGPETKIIDLKGKLVTAGFNDAHIHFLGGSMGLSEVELSSTLSLDEVIASTQNFIQQNPQKEWITGRGWQYTFFQSGLPDHTTMKALDIDKPVFIKAYDGHSAYANKKALALAGVTASTKFDGFGELVKDKSGVPTGALKEDAMSLVGEFIPPPSYEDKLNALRKGLALAASLGITSAQNASGSETDVKLFKELLDRGELTMRYAAAFSVDDKTTAEEIERYTFIKDSIGSTHPMLRADAVKFMLDGVIESHSAAMLQAYEDVAPHAKDAIGSLSMPVARYQELVRLCDQKGFRIYTHAIGDLGVRETLNAYEKAMTENKSIDKRHRVEHIETISPDDLPRFKKLGIMPSMEPIHADPGTIAVWEKAIGPQRLPYSFAWNAMLNAGGYLVYSSDWPAAISINPIRGIHVAVNRRNPSGYPEGGWVSAQKIRIDQALKAYTYAGAYSSFEEKKKGLLEPGYLADVIVFSEDLFLIEPMKTHEAKIVLTVFDGKVIYDKL
jgi:predicted amidohydrolase YtcJ